MSRPRTRLCANETCETPGKPFEYERSTARYCPECRRKESYRDRRDPVVEERPVVYQQPRPGRKRLGDAEGWGGIPGSRSEGELDDVLWKLSLSPERRAEETWEEILWQAIEDLVWALHPRRRSAGFHRIEPVVAVGFWKREYANHPELLTAVPKLYSQARAAIEAEKERKMIETVAAQNELILARQQETLDRLERLQDLAAETFAKVADTARRVGEKFPNDSEVAAAVDRLLEDVGATVAEDELP